MLDDASSLLVHNSLRIGEYNLLLGSGISLDSTNSSGERLDGVSELTAKLCAAVGLGALKPLSVVASILDEKQQLAFLTKPYTVAQAGKSVTSLPTFIWRRIFSLNIDDAVEVAYESAKDSLQSIVSVNYDED